MIVLQIWTFELTAKRAAFKVGIIYFKCFFQFMWLSICNPRSFYSLILVYAFFYSQQSNAFVVVGPSRAQLYRK